MSLRLMMRLARLSAASLSRRHLASRESSARWNWSGQIEHEMANDIETIPGCARKPRKQALIKLHGVTNKIGYPDKWRDYSSLNLVDGDYFGNFYRANEFESKRDRNKIGKPVDKSEWGMTPPTVNAYYNPQREQHQFPGGDSATAVLFEQRG